MQPCGVIQGMWDRKLLQEALLGTPANGDPRQIFFGAEHVDRHQFDASGREPRRASARKNEERKTNRPERTAPGFLRSSFFDFR